MDGEPTVIIASTRQRPAVLALGMLLAAVSVLLVAGPAQAHTELVSSDPADGAVLAVAPASVSLTFSEALLPDTTTVSVNAADGTVIASTSVEPDGATVSVPWPAEASEGTFLVAYRVVAEDGHPLSGQISVTIGTATPASAAAESPAAVAADAEQPTRGIAGALVVTVLIAVVVLAVVAAAIIIRRRRSL